MGWYKPNGKEQVREYLEESAFWQKLLGNRGKTLYAEIAASWQQNFCGEKVSWRDQEYVSSKNIDIVIFDDELSGSQISNIERPF